MDRDESIEEYYEWSARSLAEKVVDLEDEIEHLKAVVKLNGDHVRLLSNALDSQELDPERLDKVLRSFISDLDYDVHKTIQCGEDDGVDHYPETVEFFLSLWEEAGK